MFFPFMSSLRVKLPNYHQIILFTDCHVHNVFVFLISASSRKSWLRANKKFGQSTVNWYTQYGSELHIHLFAHFVSCIKLVHIGWQCGSGWLAFGDSNTIYIQWVVTSNNTRVSFPCVCTYSLSTIYSGRVQTYNSGAFYEMCLHIFCTLY